MERQFLLYLLDRKNYEKVKNFLSQKLLTGQAANLLTIITQVFGQSTSIQHLGIDELVALYLDANQLTTAQKELFDLYIAQLRMTEKPNDEIAEQLIKSFYVKEIQRRVAEEAIRGINENRDCLERLHKLLQDIPVAGYAQSRRNAPVDSGISSLLSANDPSSRFTFPIRLLQERTTGIGRGNLGVIFGRPEIGKSSFVSFLTAWYISNGLKVEYFANEEPGYKIILNIVRATLKLTDDDIRARHAKGDKFEAWEKVRGNLHLYDAVGLDVDEANSHVASAQPDVVIFDQADKMRISGEYSADHSKLKDIYVHTREIAKRNNCLVWNISQASAEAHDKMNVTYEMLDNSKTGKAGEADMIIGIGKNPGIDEDFVRHLTVSKNKINGWHGKEIVTFNPATNQWS